MPSREEAKEIRRQRILEAARSLIRETARTRFSMRMLAEKSGVSLVTPYNLFGSKQAIMGTLLDEDIGQFAKQLGRSRKDPLDRILHAVSLGCLYFRQDESYYRAVLSAVYAEGSNDDYRSRFGPPRLALWRTLVQTARDEGFLRQDVDCGLLGSHLSGTFYANILFWAAGDTPLKEMEQRTLYAFAMALYANARPAHTARLREQINTAQAAVKRLRAARRSTNGARTQRQAAGP
jgi:AcrR family transcriptional regulator